MSHQLCQASPAWEMAQHRLPKAGQEHGSLLPVHQQEDKVPTLMAEDSVG